MTISTLESLPPELLDNILDYLHLDDAWWGYYGRLEHLAALSQTSKTMYAVSVPHLYRVIKYIHGRKPLRKLLRTLERKPHFGKHIRTLHIQPDTRARTTSDPCEAIQYVPALAPLKTTPVYLDLHTALHKGCATAEALALLAYATQVRRLRVTLTCVLSTDATERCPHCPPYPYFLHGIIFFLRVYDKRNYAHLSKVVLNGKNSRKHHVGTHAGLAQLFLDLPSMHSLQAFDMLGRAEDAIGLHKNHLDIGAISRIKNLDLDNCMMDSSGVAMLVTQCTELNRITVGWNWIRGVDADGRFGVASLHTDMSCLLRALLRHKSSLQHLRLTGPTFQAIEFFAGSPWIGKLDILHALEYLEIDEKLITGGIEWRHLAHDSILPECLQRLVINTGKPLNDLPEIMSTLCPLLPCDLRSATITSPFWHPGNDGATKVVRAKVIDGELVLGRISRPCDRDWTMVLGNAVTGSLTINLKCWKVVEPVSHTMRKLVAKMRREGVENLLSSRCPRHWPTAHEALKQIARQDPLRLVPYL